MDTVIKKYPLLQNNFETQQLVRTQDKCDTCDYLTAIACGAIGGMIDIFLVGAPGDSVLENWTDTQVDNAVKGFAQKMGWPAKDPENVASAIGFLEKGASSKTTNKLYFGEEFKGFKVNYDQRHSGDVDNLFKMSAKNHHMMSLAHSPDIIGLFFSILNQFTSTSSFIANGQLITIKTDTFELQGGNFIAKLFCGVANWFGHIMSDIAGSSGSSGRGSGIVMPFYELFSLCKFGKFSVEKDKQDLAAIATRAFQEGYDFRFGLAAAIPVVITELSIRLILALRQYFQYEMPLKECIPTSKHDDLRMMLLVGHGTLCLIDGVDAGIRSATSGGNFLIFFTRLNLVAWYRLAILVIKEVCIRVGISAPLQTTLDAYKKINETLSAYLKELEKIDITRFKKETEKYNQLISILEEPVTQVQLNEVLLHFYNENDFKKPWEGDFNEHMANKKGTLVFE